MSRTVEYLPWMQLAGVASVRNRAPGRESPPRLLDFSLRIKGDDVRWPVWVRLSDDCDVMVRRTWDGNADQGSGRRIGSVAPTACVSQAHTCLWRPLRPRAGRQVLLATIPTASGAFEDTCVIFWPAYSCFNRRTLTPDCKGVVCRPGVDFCRTSGNCIHDNIGTPRFTSAQFRELNLLKSQPLGHRLEFGQLARRHDKDAVALARDDVQPGAEDAPNSPE